MKSMIVGLLLFWQLSDPGSESGRFQGFQSAVFSSLLKNGSIFQVNKNDLCPVNSDLALGVFLHQSCIRRHDNEKMDKSAQE